MTRPRLPILIAGAGIGGLAAGLALARRGFSVEVLEKGPAPSEEGAGIQLAPNATRVLADLGVLDHLEGVGVEPESLRLRDGANGRVLVELPLGAWLRARHGAPYRLLHRADLANALAACVEAEPRIRVIRDFDLRAVTMMGDEVVATLDASPGTSFHGTSIAGIGALNARGDAAFGDALIGADGLWSEVRASVTGACRPEATGWTARRALIGWRAAAPEFHAPRVNAWLSAEGHVVHYPVRPGSEIAAIVVTKGGQLSGEPGRETLLPALAGIAPELCDFLALAPAWRRWPIYAAPPGAIHQGRIALLGDAARPLVPYLAQGAAMALEDAVVLAASLAANPEDVPAAFAAYAAKRRARLARVAAASHRNGRIYHLGWPLAPARNAILRLTPPKRLMTSLDWLYGGEA